MTPDWSSQQEAALNAVGEWLRDENGPQIFRLFGYAGTGKTTLAKEFGGEDVCYAAFTGKAALVMQSKGCDDASTIHSLIYRPDDETAGEPRFVINEDSKLTG